MKMFFLRNILSFLFFVVDISVSAQSVSTRTLLSTADNLPVNNLNSETNITVSASIPLCPDSHVCPGNCQASREGCKCDSLCQLFGDCCLHMSCSNQEISVRELDKLNIDYSQTDCVVPTLESSSSSEISLNGFYMVDKCPDYFMNLDLIEKCLHPNSTDLQSTIPVSEQQYGVTFRNIYCALCNDILTENVVWWQLQARCGEDILPSIQRSLANGATLAETLTVINEFCPISFGSPGKFVSNIGNRPCYPHLENPVMNCLVDTSKETLDRCEGYTALVIDDEGQVYRNPDCYLCSHSIDKDIFEVEIDCENGDNSLPKIFQSKLPVETPAPPIQPPVQPPIGPIGPGGPIGGIVPIAPPGGFPGLGPDIPLGRPSPDRPDPIPIPPPGRPATPPPPDPELGVVPISIIVDFSSNSGVTIAIHDTIVFSNPVTCEDGEVYDPFADTCRVLSCPEGYALISDQCIFMPLGTEDHCSGDFIVSVNATSDSCITSVESPSVACMRNILMNLALPIRNESAECFDEYSVHTFIINSTTQFTELEKAFDSLFLTEEAKTSAIDLCNVNNFDLKLLCDTTIAGCDRQVELTEVWVEHRNLTTIIHSGNVEYLFSSGSLLLQYEHESDDNLYTKFISAELCDTSNVSCPLITLNASLFIPFSETEILLESTGETFAQHEYKYDADGQIQICSVFERNGTRNETHVLTFIAYDPAQTILSLIGSIISMIALAATFLTYAVFASLRTPAIKAIMHLTVALFMAQLIFLLAAGSTENQEFCTSVAVILHYLWLCTFTWSTVLSFDLNMTFSSKLVRRQQDAGTPIYPYVLYGWLSPLLVIIPCLAIHICACLDVPFSYGNTSACWIYNQYANLVVFGVPLVICLMINCIFFFNILWNIHKTKRNVRHMKKGQSRMAHIKEELSIYVKIATLMGFTWIFAFSAAFSGVSALWYIYIIVNSLQGLYIFVAFIFNRRVANLWKNKITGSRLVEHLFESTATSKTGNRHDRVIHNPDPNVKNNGHELKDNTSSTLLRGQNDASSMSSASKY